MSAAIKKMLAERAALAEQDVERALSPSKQEEIDLVEQMIDTAKPFIDEHARDPTKWRPSELLTIGYFVISTGDHPDAALEFVVRHLNTARKRYKAGLDPNPFAAAETSHPPVLAAKPESSDSQGGVE